MRFDLAVNFYRNIRAWFQGRDSHERTLELLGTMLANQVKARTQISSLHEVEFRVYSQFGDDGIIQWLLGRRPDLPRRFVEFGVEDYSEANTRFLMTNDNWSGLVLDGSATNMTRLRQRKWFWRHDLSARHCFMTRENVDQTIQEWSGGQAIGILHIDVDGNDYWLWEAIVSCSPSIVIMEYNALFGADRPITIPYSRDFSRHAAHFSAQYFGASLAALTHLAKAKGYGLIGTNRAGNNAYFVRRDILGDDIREVDVASAYTQAKFRDSRNRQHQLEYLSFAQRQALIRGLPMCNVATGCEEPF